MSLRIGTAGEHLVCADLLLAGYDACMSAAGLAYDVILDYRGRLIRVGVKATSSARQRPEREGSRLCYQFAVTRARALKREPGRFDARAYTPDDVDMFALVALDIRAVAYVPIHDCKTSMHLDAPHCSNPVKLRFERKSFDRFPLHLALRQFQ